MSSRDDGPITLAQSVEITELFDVQDSDVGGYIQELINSCSQFPRKRRFDFSAPADAYAALAIVERAAGHIASRMRTVRALRTLLKTRPAGDDFEMQ